MQKKVFIPRLINFLTAVFVLFAFFVIPNHAIGADPAKFTDSTYKTIEYNGTKYTWMFDSYCLSGSTPWGTACDRPRTDNREALHAVDPGNPINASYFVVNQQEWDQNNFSCSTQPPDSPKKWIRIWKSGWEAAKKGGQIGGGLYSFTKVLPFCTFQAQSIGGIDILPYLKSNPASTTYVWDGKVAGPNYDPSSVSIKETQPSQQTFVYNSALSNPLNNVFKTFSGDTAIAVNANGFSLNLPGSGALYPFSGGKVDFSNKLSDITIVDPNSIKPHDISGRVCWGGGACSPQNWLTFKGSVPMKVDLIDSNGTKLRSVNVDSTGNYVISQVPLGSYTVSISFKTSDDFVAWVESINGLLDKKETDVSGKTDVEITAAGVDPSPTDISLQAGTLTTPGLVSNLVNNTLLDATKTMVSGMNTGIKMASDWVMQIIDYTNKMGQEGQNSGIQQAWIAMRNLTLSLLTLALIIIAFANVISIDLEKYGVDKMIPRLVIGIVMTYFSFLIAKVLLELASALQLALLTGTTTVGGIDFGSGSLLTASSNLGENIVFIILAVAIFLVLCYLCLVLMIRLILIWFLVILAPMAFIMNIMPFTEFLYQMWWKIWWKWLFIGPATIFFLWVGSQIVSAYKVTTGMNSLIQIMLAAVAIAIAAIIPLQLGGEIVGKLNSALGSLPGVAHAKEYWKQRQAQAAERRSRGVLRGRAALSRIPIIGRGLAGVSLSEAGALRGEAAGANKAMFSKYSKGDLNRYIARTWATRGGWAHNGMSHFNRSAVEAAAEAGTLDDHNHLSKSAAMYWSSRINPLTGAQTQNAAAIEGAIKKNQKELFAQSFGDGTLPASLTRYANRVAVEVAEKTPAGLMHFDQLDHLFHNANDGRVQQILNRVANNEQAMNQVLRMEQKNQAGWGQVLGTVPAPPQNLPGGQANNARVAYDALTQAATDYMNSHPQNQGANGAHTVFNSQ